MKPINEAAVSFLSRSSNEGFARTAAACFAAQLDPTLEEINDIKTLGGFDEIIVATGSVPRTMPMIPGFEKTMSFTELLKEKKEVGDKVLFFGGGQSSCEAAYDLILQGKHPIIVEYAGDLVAAQATCLANTSFLRDAMEYHKVPTYLESTVTEITDNGPKTVERKVFPGYVLVKMVMTDDTWHLVRNIRGATGFVGSGNKAIPLTDEEIAALGVEKREVVVGYQVGDNVKITDGALESFLGTVEEIDLDRSKVRVVVSMFGRETPVELELDQVEPVE